MRLRKLALAVGLAGVLSAEMASALGLGEIKLNSDLNEPLDAEIKLLQIRDLSDGEILVSLASKDDFKNSGVDRTFFLNELKFKVDLNNPKGPVVKVTSKKPVREPYLNFLVQTQWPNGRILREYTLLMDLPVFSQDAAKTVVQRAAVPVKQVSEPKPEPKPMVKSPEPMAEKTPAPKAEPEAKPAETTPAVKGYGSESYGPVKSNDTLWEIALKVRPDNSFSVQQTMLAIQRLNPQAFIRGNINLLRKGQVLRVPAASDIRSLSARDAISQVAVQNNVWEETIPQAGPQLDASKPVSQTRVASDKVEGRLTLAASSPAQDSGTGQSGSGGDGSDAEALQNELAISLEELDKAGRENKELKDRIQELEEQITTMERLIEVSNQEMRALQLASGDKSEAADAPVITMDQAEEQADIAQSEEAMQSDPSVGSVPPKPEINQPAATPQPKPGLMATIMDNIAIVGGGVAALLLALLLLLRRRNSEEQELPLESMDSTPVTAEAEASDAESDVEVSAQVDAGDLDEDLDVDFDAEDLEAQDDNAAGSETGDAVAEADIYIAYGKFDQAEEMLLKAIDEDGAGVDAHVKLLEVYVESNELDKFDRQYVQVLGLNDPQASERAAELRANFSGAPEFDPASVELEESTEVVGAGDDSLDFDFGELETVSDSGDFVDGVQEDSDERFDFDLDLDDDLGLAAPEKGDGLPDLDFDLDSDPDPEQSEDFSADLHLDLDTDAPLEFESIDLELDEASSSSTEEDAPVEDSDFSEGFTLDVDALDDIEDQGVELDLNLEEGSLELAEGTLGDSAEEFALEDTALDVEQAGETEEVSGLPESDEFQSFDLDGDTLEPDVPEDSEDSDFDLNLGDDVDLASLDEDLEALSGEIEAGENSQSELGADLDSPSDLDLELDTALDLDIDDTVVELDTSFDADITDIDDLELNELAESVSENEALDSGEALDDVIDLDLASDLELTDDFQQEESLDLGVELSEQETVDSEALVDESLSEFDHNEEVVADVAGTSLEGEAESLSDVPDSSDQDEGDALEVAPEEDELAVEDFEPGEDSLDLDMPTVAETDAEHAPVAETEDEVFTQALSDLPDADDIDFSADELSVNADELVAEDELEAELDFLAETDEVSTKLDLARAYIDMGDKDGAKDILDEVVQEGSDQQRQEAEELLSRV